MFPFCHLLSDMRHSLRELLRSEWNATIKTRRLLATDGHLLSDVSINVQHDRLGHVNINYL